MLKYKNGNTDLNHFYECEITVNKFQFDSFHDQIIQIIFWMLSVIAHNTIKILMYQRI